jgi:hypothetical protein
VAEPSSFESKEGISPIADGGILSSSIIYDAEMKGIRANLKVEEVMLDETSPQASKSGTHGPLAHAHAKKNTQINTDLKEAERLFKSEQGVIEQILVDEPFSMQGSKADGFDLGTKDNEKRDDVSSMAKIRDLQVEGAFVNCVDGFNDDGDMTCKDACAGEGLNCCVGGYDLTNTYRAACSGFTGKVYSNSCNGAAACESAKIQTVKNSCKAFFSCYRAGMVGGVGNMIDSCQYNFACMRMAKHADITRSCKKEFACYDQGVAGNMIDSCNEQFACDRMAEHANMTGSCNAAFSCHFQGVVTTNMLYCCNTYKECDYANTDQGDPLPATCMATSVSTSESSREK